MWTLTDKLSNVVTFDIDPRQAHRQMKRNVPRVVYFDDYPVQLDQGSESHKLDVRADFWTQSKVTTLQDIASLHSRQPVVLSGAGRYDGKYILKELRVEQKTTQRWQTGLQLIPYKPLKLIYSPQSEVVKHQAASWKLHLAWSPQNTLLYIDDYWYNFFVDETDGGYLSYRSATAAGSSWGNKTSASHLVLCSNSDGDVGDYSYTCAHEGSTVWIAYTTGSFEENAHNWVRTGTALNGVITWNDAVEVYSLPCHANHYYIHSLCKTKNRTYYGLLAHDDWGTAYYTYHRCYYTTDGGKTWTNISLSTPFQNVSYQGFAVGRWWSYDDGIVYIKAPPYDNQFAYCTYTGSSWAGWYSLSGKVATSPTYPCWDLISCQNVTYLVFNSTSDFTPPSNISYRTLISAWSNSVQIEAEAMLYPLLSELDDALFLTYTEPANPPTPRQIFVRYMLWGETEFSAREAVWSISAYYTFHSMSAVLSDADRLGVDCETYGDKLRFLQAVITTE